MSNKEKEQMEDTKQTNQQAPAAVGIARYFGRPVRRTNGDVIQEYVQHPKGKFVTYEDAMAYAARKVAEAEQQRGSKKAEAGPVVDVVKVDDTDGHAPSWYVTINGYHIKHPYTFPFDAKSDAEKIRQALAAPQAQPQGVKDGKCDCKWNTNAYGLECPEHGTESRNMEKSETPYVDRIADQILDALHNNGDLKIIIAKVILDSGNDSQLAKEAFEILGD